MKIIVYTKSACPNCVSAKHLLKANNLPYEERSMDDPAERMAFSMLFPDIRQMPQIFVDGQRLGGLAGLQSALTTLLDARAQT